ncbi:N-acetylmuramoyl-L-alanine amidase, partial [bacterium]|nr:N-acetylmuramoyl-L-alanine amidase [bacterium]
ISLPELASATGCSYYQAAPYHYLHFNGHPIRLMVGSFFFDRGGEVCQLAAAPLLEAGELFLPLSLLSQLHPPEGDWHYDPLARELLVRQPEGVQGFSIAELPEGVLLRLHLDQVPDYAGDSVNHSGRLVFAKADVPQACLPTVIYHPDISGFRVTTPGDELQVEFDYASTLELLEIFESDDHKRISFLFGSGSALALETELPAWTPPVGWSLDTIIIDPGHGGRDPGAVSPWGMYEKTITLAIGLELERLLKEDGRFQVYMTRRDDRFVSPKDRTRFANQHAGKLFISIHCNAARNRSARGFETFLLRTARNEYALNVALKENAVVRLENAPEQYDAMRTDNYILMSLAQSAFVQESAQFALQLKPHLSPLIRPHSRGISQAGFYVLWGASMPAVLLESGFITNKRDYNLLKSAKGRKQLARALFDSILDFKRQYENN